MKVIIEQATESSIPVFLTADEARLFVEFKKHYKVIAYLVGFMESMKIEDMKETNIMLDVDKQGIVSHAAITKQFRS